MSKYSDDLREMGPSQLNQHEQVWLRRLAEARAAVKVAEAQLRKIEEARK